MVKAESAPKKKIIREWSDSGDPIAYKRVGTYHIYTRISKSFVQIYLRR